MRGKKSGKGDYYMRRGKASNSGTDTHQLRGTAHNGPKHQIFGYEAKRCIFHIQLPSRRSSGKVKITFHIYILA